MDGIGSGLAWSSTCVKKRARVSPDSHGQGSAGRAHRLDGLPNLVGNQVAELARGRHGKGKLLEQRHLVGRFVVRLGDEHFLLALANLRLQILVRRLQSA